MAKLLLKYHLPLYFLLELPLVGLCLRLGLLGGVITKNDYIKMSNINVMFLIFLSGLKLKRMISRRLFMNGKAQLMVVL